MAAAFGRLCVETRALLLQEAYSQSQPPSGGCVLKRPRGHASLIVIPQPPSGGCVLKPLLWACSHEQGRAAAFGRLCVETTSGVRKPGNKPSSRLRAAVC